MDTSLATTLLQAVGLFAVTNLDHLMVLMILFAHWAGQSSTTGRILLGQLLGFGAMLVIIIAAALGLGWVIPPNLIALFGLVPLILGLRAAVLEFREWRERRAKSSPRADSLVNQSEDDDAIVGDTEDDSDDEEASTRNTLTQDGVTPAEDPQELLSQLETGLRRLERIIATVNQVNASTQVEGQSLTQMIARKDVLTLRIEILRRVANSASHSADRYSPSEIRIMRTVDVQALQKQIDQLAKELRELDNKLQEANWTTEVNLLELFLGSEGCFGVVTRLRLRLHRLPQSVRYEAFSFPDFTAGATGVRAVAQAGTNPTVIRLSDEIESALNLSSTDHIGSDQERAKGCMCLTMFEGEAELIEMRHLATRKLLLEAGGRSLGENPVRQWEKGRFGAPVLRDALLDAGALCETLETATTWSNVSRLKQAVGQALTQTLAKNHSRAIVMCHISHIYHTGCSLYFTVVGAQNDTPVEQWLLTKQATLRAITENGGTITHHHGVGTDHQSGMESEISPLGQQLLWALKDTLDPHHIMNPGKLLGGDAR